MKQDLNTSVISIDELCVNNKVSLAKARVNSARIDAITSQAELDLVGGGGYVQVWAQVHGRVHIPA